MKGTRRPGPGNTGVGGDNPYPIKHHCTCENPLVGRNEYGDECCFTCGHAPLHPRPVAIVGSGGP